MARPPSVPAPTFTLDAACAAVARLRAGRERAGDRDLAFYPPSAQDDDDVDAAVAYLMRPTRVPARTRAEEIPDRALLVEYQRQRDAALYQRRLSAVLNAGHTLAVPATAYGRLLGLPTRYAVYKRRTRLVAPDSEPRPAQGEAPVEAWLAENHRGLLDVAEVLVDRREELLQLVDDDSQRDELALAIDQGGAHISARPSRALAAAIAYAMYLLRPAGPARQPDDEDMQVALRRGMVLRDGFVTVRTAQTDPAG